MEYIHAFMHARATSCFLLRQQSKFRKQTGRHPIPPPPLPRNPPQSSKPLPFPFKSSFCSKVSFQRQATGYQLLGASPAATPPLPPPSSSIPPLFSLQLLRVPVADGKIRHHDTNKLSPYFKKAHRGSVCACVCVDARVRYHSRSVAVCACGTDMRVCTLQRVYSKMPRQQLLSAQTNVRPVVEEERMVSVLALPSEC